MTGKEEEKTELIYKEESYAIIGACMAAYKDKGCGFLEPVYHECLAIEFEFRGIPFLSKPPQTLAITQSCNTSGSYRDTRNPSIFGFKNFRVFRVFRGQRNL